MTVENIIESETVKRLADITHSKISNEFEMLLALNKLFGQYDNQAMNIEYLLEQCNQNGVKTIFD